MECALPTVRYRCRYDATLTDHSHQVVFKRAQTAAAAKGVRFVAINRRHFPGSTPFSQDELNLILSGGEDSQKDVHWDVRGRELASFVGAFAQQNNLPPVSSDGKAGGIIILGWSVGAALALSSIASSHTIQDAGLKSALASHVRALILYGISLSL